MSFLDDLPEEIRAEVYEKALEFLQDKDDLSDYLAEFGPSLLGSTDIDFISEIMATISFNFFVAGLAYGKGYAWVPKFRPEDIGLGEDPSKQEMKNHKWIRRI